MFKKSENTEKTTNQKAISKPPILFDESQFLLEKIGKFLDAPIITYYNGSGGSICNNDAVAIYELLARKERVKHLYFCISSDGGNGIAALRIVNILRNSCEKLTLLVPANCASAATMLALGADEIIMGPLAFLTAVDTSLTHDLSPVDKNNSLVSVSMDELNRVMKLWQENIKTNDENPYKTLYNYIHPLVFGAVDRASSLSLKICREILSYHLNDEEKIMQIAQKLNSDYPAHEYPILLREARSIGLNIKEMDADLAVILRELMQIYAKMCDRKFTDYNENSYHDSSVMNIIESGGAQIYYKVEKDWFYRQEERRWNTMNDESSWIKTWRENGKQKSEILHLR